VGSEVGPDDDGVPVGLRRAWGLEPRPTRGPKRALTLEGIVGAAVAVAASEGLGAVSMQRVAADLGVAPMSLYRYVDGKQELLTLMADHAYGPPPDLVAGETWREGLATWAWAERATLARHAWVVRVPITGPPSTPHEVAWMERGLAALVGTDLRPDEKLSTILLVSSYVRSEVTLTSEVHGAFDAAGRDPHEAMHAYGALLARLADPVRFPAIRSLIEAGTFDDDSGHPDDEFRFGLERVLDGIAVLVDRRAAEAGRGARAASPPATARAAKPTRAR
jgi:AcrR family transcriptional regulator